MASTTFTNGVTLTDAEWFNDTDTVVYDLFGNGSAYTGNFAAPGTIVGSLATDATSTTTGAWRTAGGIGIAKALWVGGQANIAGASSNSAAPAASFFIRGGQLGFPPTQVASTDVNTLDDYEEGSWTIGLTFGGASVGLTTSSNTGYYTKIGNIVNCTGHLVLTAKGSSTGGALISGLPFTIANNSAAYSAVSLYFSAVSYTGQVAGFGDINATTITLRDITEAGSAADLDNTNFADTSQIIFSITYRVA